MGKFNPGTRFPCNWIPSFLEWDEDATLLKVALSEVRSYKKSVFSSYGRLRRFHTDSRHTPISSQPQFPGTSPVAALQALSPAAPGCSIALPKPEGRTWLDNSRSSELQWYFSMSPDLIILQSLNPGQEWIHTFHCCLRQPVSISVGPQEGGRTHCHFFHSHWPCLLLVLHTSRSSHRKSRPLTRLYRSTSTFSALEDR